MQIKKLLVLSTLVCGIVSTGKVTAATNDSVRFTAGLRLSGYLQKQKSNATLSSSAVVESLEKAKPDIDSVNVNVEEVNARATNIKTRATNGNTSSYQARILAARFDGNEKKWKNALTLGEWANDGKFVFGGQGVVFAGIKFGSAMVKLGFLMEYPFSNKTTTIGHSSNDSSSSSSSDSSSSNSNSLFDITETKKLAYGFLLGADVYVNNCFIIGIEGGLKRIHREYDVSKANKNLLGFDGIPDDLGSYNKTALNSEATKRTDGLSTVNKIDAKKWVSFAGLNFGIQINKHFAVVLGAGVQGGCSFDLRDGSSKISNPDYTINTNTAFYANIGVQAQI